MAFHYWKENGGRMTDELENFHRLHRRTWTGPVHKFKPVAPMPSNTLTNADGTPYQAGYDEKTLGQIAYEAFTQHPDYQRLFAQKTGYRLSGPEWRTLSHVEQRIWEEVAQAVLADNETVST